MAALTPITALDPETRPPPDKTIRAVVSLYWPYSSSTKQCAFLLTDPDPRLRSRRGQVRVRFTLASATAVAQGKIGIGDEVLLNLRGAQWSSYSSTVSTPGKSVEGELVYRGDLSLRVVKKAGSNEAIDQRIDVNVSTPPPDEDPPVHQTPIRNTRVASLRDSLGAVDLVPIYSSPAFIRRQRLSGDGFGAGPEYDPFADIDRELDDEQPRKRQRISDVSFWRFADRTPSPQKRTAREGVEEQIDMAAATSGVRHEVDVLNGRGGNASPISNTSPTPSSLPVKLSPLPPAKSDVAQPLQEPPASMLPPPLPKLRMPDNPFMMQSEEDHDNSTQDPKRPVTPELKAVPGYTLPIPSPFPQESAQPSIEPDLATAQKIAEQQEPSTSPQREDRVNDEVRLVINPTIAALASSPSQGSPQRSNKSAQGRARGRNQASRSSGSPRSIGASSKQSQAFGSQTAYQSQSYGMLRQPPDSSQEVYPDHQGSGSDTEEDEEMQKVYDQRALSHARAMLEREGVKIRDWVHRDDAAEVIEDMGERPETSSDEDFDEEHDDESNEDDDMLDAEDDDYEDEIDVHLVTGLRSPDPSQTTARQSVADRAADPPINVSGRISQRPAHDRPKSSPPEGLDVAEPVEGQSAATSVMSSQPATMSKELAANEEVSAKISASSEAAATHPVAQSALTQPERRLPPKTPEKTIQSLFGFGFGMDGTNDVPFEPIEVTKPTPQSEKERIMKKTYSSLFGFKASPSPEKERTPAPQILETPTPFGVVQREASDVEVPSAQSQSAPVAPLNDFVGSQTPSDTNHISSAAATAGTIASNAVPPQHDPLHIDEPLAESQGDSQLISESQPVQSIPMVDVAASQPGIDSNLTSQDTFPSLEVQLSETSQPEQEQQEDHVLRNERHTVSSVDQPAQLSEPTSQIAVPLDSHALDDMPSAESMSQQQASVEDDAPFDDEALVASMLRDATPVLPSSQVLIGDVATPVDNPGERKPRSSPAIPRTSEESSHTAPKEVRKDAPLPGTAPVRSLGSKKVDAPPTSTAPKRAQVEVIDLDTSDESDAEDDVALPSQPMQIDTIESHDILADIDDLDDRSYSPTEVASSPAVEESADVDMPDVVSDLDASHELIPEPDLQHADTSASAANETSFFENEMQASGISVPTVTPSNPPPQSQISEAPSTQSKGNKMADHYHYFSFQSTGSDDESSEAESEDARVELTEQAPQSVAVNEQVTTKPQARLGVRESSFPDDLINSQSQPAAQQSQQPALPSPKDSQPRQQTFFAETQHRIESQPFETQLPVPLPTPEITNEGLKLAKEAPVEEKAPPATPKRKHTRKTSAKENMAAVVRRSPRNAESLAEQEVQETAVPKRQTRSQRTASPEPAPASTRRQTRSQRTASPEPSQISSKRQTRSQRTVSPEPIQRQTNAQRTATPENTISSMASFDGKLLSPAPLKPVRRSPRKSRALTESFEEAAEARGDNTTEVKSRQQTAKKSTKKQLSQRQTEEDEHQHAGEDATLVPEQVHIESAEGKPTSAVETPSAAAPKTPGRKSLAARLGQVPEVISSWFSPRRSTRQQLEEDSTLVADATNEKADLLQRTTSNGLITSSAYYTPLSNLHEKLNPSSQPGVDNTIDILAVVTDDTKAPERAKGGPRDYFTIFKIADPSTSTSAKVSSVRVEVFRPWHATLPVAQKGDVILLRSFAVKSRKRQPYLLSTDASAWLVWRFGEDAQRPGSAGSPKRSTRRGSLVGPGVREEVKGPPVELGSEERQRARELREWWQGVSGDLNAAAVEK
ncbi:hypothetical protein CB0940_09500 [Cercospora beticola]|uniref:Telomeric single stranded DNA binding POT1/Cdc13 domain-containing protein n=1 Tax=Cercospora beticola TaxID=122368 RepID=A0A2G5HG20_CERBT|nr:hypothetical protein CB0940_09500 [Cercospora beticola]PIA91481.1 hypothetical protein CB0940_09500 [Cercospora beticola]WPB06181.1 hypothetical protein RHO25_010838 [Cercospora beticola]